MNFACNGPADLSILQVNKGIDSQVAQRDRGIRHIETTALNYWATAGWTLINGVY
jgi:hypothetical protein